MQSDTENNLIEGEIADYLLTDEGMLIAYSRSVLRTVESISRNVDLVKRITNNKPAPLLIYLKTSPIPDKETRRISAKKLPEIYTAMAMVSKPGLAQFIMRILFKFQNPPIPMKSFTDDKKAMEWLKRFL
ncbi:STAS/SEC14 domain-containing protein [Pedobacter sp. Leaf194]|uniref:DUF7793 family protein n=1 Tax=Pedobacter sp. Leaf194 TaxID=1736297 RepID=UPI0007039D31|nr:STAS/SEC14 domain-containing protein [Pedobacter sp. Leaf194]KQS41609.1 hypothetical protein ASG14_03895 [Pedobacter sp. Leaf194]